MTDVIDSAAFRVAEAEQKLDAANATVTTAKKAADEIAARIAALETERGEIIDRARAGDTDGKFGLRLAVLTADGGDLCKIAADAQSGIVTARAAVERAKQALLAAEKALQLVKDEELERQLVAYVDELAVKLGSGIAELRAIWRHKRARPTWAPTPELTREITRLRLTADNRVLAA